MSMIISKGTVCYGSITGEYNFYYPNLQNELVLDMTIEVENMPWLKYDKYEAVRVTSPENFLPYKILWIKQLPV